MKNDGEALSSGFSLEFPLFQFAAIDASREEKIIIRGRIKNFILLTNNIYNHPNIYKFKILSSGKRTNRNPFERYFIIKRKMAESLTA
jgi:hypothetical protein